MSLSLSYRRTTTFSPCRSCLATTEARRPSRWSFPSITTALLNKPILIELKTKNENERNENLRRNEISMQKISCEVYEMGKDK